MTEHFPPNALIELAALLDAIGLKSVVRPDRVAVSPLYDLEYRVFVTACTFDRHAAEYGLTRRMRADRLKLFQFVATHPWLLDVIREWSASRRDAERSLLTSERLRRGYLSDVVHDHVVDYLVAAQALMHRGDHIEGGPKEKAISQLADEVIRNKLFAAERNTIDQLLDIKVTSRMLEGL